MVFIHSLNALSSNTISWYLAISAFRAQCISQEASKSLQYVLYQGDELKLPQDTYTKPLAFKEQPQDCWSWDSGFPSGICSHEIQPWFLFCWDVDADHSKGSLCLQVYFALEDLRAWGCTFWHQQDCFSFNKNLWAALQGTVSAWDVIWLLGRK